MVHGPDIVSNISVRSAETQFVIVECPPTINEKGLLRKIDLRVIPILFLVCTYYSNSYFFFEA